MLSSFHIRALPALAGAATLALVTVPFTPPPAAQSSAKAKGPAATHEIVVTVARVKALDPMDLFSKGDFYARVTIAGATQVVPPMKQQAEIAPNWKLAAKVPPGRHAVKLEILDKDLTRDDPVDINRVEGKRHQDFTVDTRSCRITGFAGANRCGTTITRSGTERKKAEVAFSVSVNK
jgi:hypothetical protein